jgi:alpha-glucosidase
LKGITSKVDYLKDLGVDIVWLSPIYESPQADMGYDISNYRDIDRRYGTLDDWEELKDAVHAKGMKLVMDLVVNHTSDQVRFSSPLTTIIRRREQNGLELTRQHAWFQESKKSKDNEKADWYIWQDPKHDEQGNRIPPNNWNSIFGRSVTSPRPSESS